MLRRLASFSSVCIHSVLSMQQLVKLALLTEVLENKASEKLVETLDSLYKKNVPLNVRDYIESSSDNSNSNTGNK